MNIAVITGAASGLGREFALNIDRRFTLDEIWLVDIKKDRLQNLSHLIKIKSRLFFCDVSKTSSLDELKSTAENEKPSVKILVNAAGLGKFGSVDSLSESDAEQIINVNILGLTIITKIFIPYMLSNSGIINMASVSGYVPLPYLNIYSASKAYVLHFSQALASELKNKAIRVTAVCPYWVSTDFISVAQNAPEGDSVNNFMFIACPFPVARKALRDNNNGKITSLYGCIPKIIKCLSKTIPIKCQTATWNIIRKLNNSQCNQRFPEQLPLQ